jgi:hypothetical protein
MTETEFKRERERNGREQKKKEKEGEISIASQTNASGTNQAGFLVPRNMIEMKGSRRLHSW